jgi:N-acetyl-gamma-glutamyl-phosphate/LysW-gamma-L-alpha-aminoadipyl-6-phosphate reductase
VKASVVGGSGYVGGELLRLLGGHPEVTVQQVTSESQSGRYIHSVHPNLRKICDLRFVRSAELEPCDFLFLALPHSEAMKQMESFQKLAPRIIDLSADFRLRNREEYRAWYGLDHPRADLLDQFVYGLPELHRSQLVGTRWASGVGCAAAAVILALYPLVVRGVIQTELIVAEVKFGSSAAGNTPTLASHHPERSGLLRSFQPTGHRHTAEIEQELSIQGKVKVHLSCTSYDAVRGILATVQVFLKDDLEERELWRVYRAAYADEPFIRIVKEGRGIHRYPEPKILAGTNYCDIGFEKDARGRRLVVLSALDNLVKGGAGTAIQAMNLMLGFPEKLGLEFPGLHPV